MVLQTSPEAFLGPSNLKQHLYLAPKKVSAIDPPKAVSEIRRQGSTSPNRVGAAVGKSHGGCACQ